MATALSPDPVGNDSTVLAVYQYAAAPWKCIYVLDQGTIATPVSPPNAFRVRNPPVINQLSCSIDYEFGWLVADFKCGFNQIGPYQNALYSGFAGITNDLGGVLKAFNLPVIPLGP